MMMEADEKDASCNACHAFLKFICHYHCKLELLKYYDTLRSEQMAPLLFEVVHLSAQPVSPNILLYQDHPSENKVKQKQWVCGQQDALLFDFSPVQEIYRSLKKLINQMSSTSCWYDYGARTHILQAQQSNATGART